MHTRVALGVGKGVLRQLSVLIEREVPLLYNYAYLFRELQKEVTSLLRNCCVFIFQNKCHLADLTFDLYHVVENEVDEDDHRVLPNDGGWVV